jgi:hypothetical protein
MPRTDAVGAAAIVTGHSRGIGEAIAAHLLARNVRVLGISRGESARLKEEIGDRAALSQVRLDLADSAALRAWLSQETLRQHVAGASSCLLVNNAGVLQPLVPLDKQAPEVVVRAVTVNVTAALALSAAFAAATQGCGDRRILHISSGAGRKGYAGWSVYCASKAALDNHARAVALEQLPSLRICSVAPGVIDTEMQAEIRASSDDSVPDRPRFVAMKREGRLTSADAAGRALVDLLLSSTFGSETVTEIRH